jgi:acyl CoA:acetate/3-ketoacid CoA transferase alpha subunit
LSVFTWAVSSSTCRRVAAWLDSSSSATRRTIQEARVAVTVPSNAMPAIIRATAMHLPVTVTGTTSP